ncbi:12374_t:CDS:1, partial [Acaulospora morrowiae]
ENSEIHDKALERDGIEGCIKDENGVYTCVNGENYDEKANEGINMKHRVEYKSILKYCENVKRQLNTFSNIF